MLGMPRSLRRALALGPATALAVAAACAAAPGMAAASDVPPPSPARVIVSLNRDGNIATAERIVLRAGGAVERTLPIINGFAARVPASLVTPLKALAGVRSVTVDGSGHLKSVDPVLGYDPANDEGSLSFVRNALHVSDAWKAGYAGQGVDVALIDSGVARVPGLASGNVVDGPDLSFESQYPDVRYLDTFGHGTHMASIIAGRDAVNTPAGYVSSKNFKGIAPDARIVSVKVAAADGSADVSQVIAAIDWVTQHSHDNGLNIRVLNLSYGTDSTQASVLDPLSYAVEQAWRQGIVVVVAAGNDGTNRLELANPAINPYVIAVGAEDPNHTTAAADDLVPAFAQRGSTTRHVDVVAPGVHILGLRLPNGFVDQNNADGRVGTRFIRGSGTSQATAVVSGVAALLLQKYPSATPDQLKSMITSTANPFPLAKSLWQGTGLVDVHKALALKPTSAPVQVQQFSAATGTGTLEGARGSVHVAVGGVNLTGERDIFDNPWNAGVWTAAAASNASWSGGAFNGAVWTGDAWDETGSWASSTWTNNDWTGGGWSSRSWVSRSWVANSWDSRSWVSDNWYSRSWVSDGWADASWS
jgi:serine protease AprX